MENYKNNVEFIKNEFGKYFVKISHEDNILQGTKYAGSHTNCRSCLYTITKMLKPNYVLEIGSYHYDTSNAISKAMDENGYGKVDSFDIKIGGYDGVYVKSNSHRISENYWYPFHSKYDDWKYTNEIVYGDFKNMNNDEILEKNIEILNKVSGGNKYDIIFIDGDHGYTGVKMDFEIAKLFSHENTLIVVDDIWDIRLNDVRVFFDELDVIKYDFEDWNDKHIEDDIVQNIGIISLKNK